MTYRFDPIEITNANPFLNDALDRRESVEFLANLIERAGQRGPLVIALDGAYGTGKSTFVALLRSVLENKNFDSVQLNAWQVDHSSDPLVPLVSILEESMLNRCGGSPILVENMSRVRAVAGILATRGAIVAAKALTLGALELDKEIEAVASAFAGDSTSDLIGKFKKEEALARQFRSDLTKAVDQLPEFNKQPTLVFFIDELDRCRPDFSISLLERIKHMFDIPNIVFVLSVDKHQLKAATQSIYGVNIDADEYLRKFIDIEFGMPRVNSKKFVEMCLKRSGIDELYALKGQQSVTQRESFIRFFTAVADSKMLSLRTQERCIVRLKIVLEQTPESEELQPVLAVPLIVLRSLNERLFASFVAGHWEMKELIEFFNQGGLGKSGAAERLIIAATLCYAAPSSVRDAIMNKHNAAINSTPTSPTERDYAQRFVRIVESLDSTLAPPEDVLLSIGRRVDIAANVRV